MFSGIGHWIGRVKAALIAYMQYGSYQPPIRAETDHRHGHDQQEQPKEDAPNGEPPISEDSTGDTVGKNTGYTPKKPKSKSKFWLESISIVLSGLSTFATGTYCVVAYFQLRAMNGQLNAMNTATQNTIQDATGQSDAMAKQLRAMQEQAQAMKEQLQALKDQVAIGTRTTHIDERAWITYESTSNSVSANLPLDIHTEFRDTGKTPARILRSVIVVELIFDGTDPVLPDFDSLHRVDSETILGAGQTRNVRIADVDRPIITPDMLAGLKAGSGVLVAFSKVYYIDIFEVPHWTTCCFFWNTGDATFTAYKKYNEMDDNPE